MDKKDYEKSTLSNVILNFDQWKEINRGFIKPDIGNKLWWLSFMRMFELATTFDQWDSFNARNPSSEHGVIALKKMLELAVTFDHFLRIAHSFYINKELQEKVMIEASKLAEAYDQWSKIYDCYTFDRENEISKLAATKMSELSKSAFQHGDS